MSRNAKERCGRREWLRGCLRGGILVGIVAGAEVLIRRFRQCDTTGRQACRQAITCIDCAKLCDCQLDQALSTKLATKG